MAPLKAMTQFDDERRQAKFAITEIHSAEHAVSEARRNDFDVNVAAEMLERAKAGYDSNDFQRAVELSLECKKMVYGMMMEKKQ